MPNLRLRAELLEVVENQLRASDPPETRQALERLLAAGDTREAATVKIAAALLEEIHDMLAQHVPFDRLRFAQRLDQLR
jgi:hypothetical protein